MITKKIKVNRDNRNINVNSYLLDSERGDRTINVSGRNSRQHNVARRKYNSSEAKIKRFTGFLLPIVALILVLSMGMRNINAEQVTFESELERVIELEETTEQDIDGLIDILDKEYNEENEITPENIEGSDKSYEEFMKKGEELHQLKYEEQKKKINVEEQAFEVIIKFEGYHDKPYWDYKGYSCGYGMRCSKDTTGITKEKSKVFVIDRINSIRSKYNLEQYDDNMEVALISFIYNLGHAPVGMERYIENNYINALKNMMRKYSYAGGEYMRGLALRRNYETSLF